LIGTSPGEEEAVSLVDLSEVRGEGACGEGACGEGAFILLHARPTGRDGRLHDVYLPIPDEFLGVAARRQDFVG